MKHIFVVNPNAGKRDSSAEIDKQVTAYAATHQSFDFLIYHTQAAGDAITWVRRWCVDHEGEAARFYACGGDGTLNEVVNGAIGFANIEVTVFASGSGNDYIKYYGKEQDFLSIPRLIEGEPHKVDVMRVNNRYSINICNFGFDAMVCKAANDIRHVPFFGGRNAYSSSIARCIFTHLSNYVKMSVDGEDFYDGKMLLCTLGNGRYVGGQYQCSPLSINDDGLLEVTLFRKVNIFQLIRLIGPYSKGNYRELKNIDKIMCYRRGVKVHLSSPNPFWLCVDGELMLDKQFDIQNLQQAITFICPRAN